MVVDFLRNRTGGNAVMRCVSVPSFSVALARPIILKRVFKDLSLDLTFTPTWHRENWSVRSGCIHAGFPTVAAVYEGVNELRSLRFSRGAASECSPGRKPGVNSNPGS